MGKEQPRDGGGYATAGTRQGQDFASEVDHDDTF
jgi:hypothetical protein